MKTKIAIIGYGRWGKNIVATLKTLPQCEVMYIETNDYRRLINKQNIDAVIVATPATTHARIALPFVKRGLPVFIEKPMTTSVRDAERLQHAAKKSLSHIFAGHLHLYNPAYATVKKFVQKIGRVRFVVAEGSGNGPYRSDVSAMWDWAPHDIYMMTDLLQEKPREVQAWGVSLLRPKTKLHDATYIKLTFPSGVFGFIFNTWLFPEKRKKITIVGTKSSIVFDDTAPKKVMLYKNMGPTITKKNIVQEIPKSSYTRYNQSLPLTLELKAFLDTVKNHKKPKTDAEAGLAVVKILDAAEKSINANGCSIKIQ